MVHHRTRNSQNAPPPKLTVNMVAEKMFKTAEDINKFLIKKKKSVLPIDVKQDSNPLTNEIIVEQPDDG
jgi:hypothetical protein